MNLMEKVRILSGAARYDVSCASCGSKRKSQTGGIGNTAVSGICHSWTSDGRCVSLLKILLSNKCIYDCAYCVNRCGNDVERASFTTAEIIRLTMDFYQRNYIEGLFLSSGIEQNPDYTVEKMTEIARELRMRHRYNGYIHLKIVPGADSELIRQAGLFADRLSVNIELPSEVSLNALAPQKKRHEIMTPMSIIGKSWRENQAERKAARGKNKVPEFAPGGQSTQMIIGASPESDYQIVALSESLYRSFSLKRVYYSAYVPMNNDARLPVPGGLPPLRREHRLYQADWLMRFYGFQAREILSPENPNLDLELDPKAAWAMRHLENFPVEINSADYECLLRVPGIGVKSAARILRTRRISRIRPEDLKRIGIVMKRARFFITVNGQYQGKMKIRQEKLRQQLLLGENPENTMFQPELFARQEKLLLTSSPPPDPGLFYG